MCVGFLRWWCIYLAPARQTCERRLEENGLAADALYSNHALWRHIGGPDPESLRQSSEMGLAAARMAGVRPTRIRTLMTARAPAALGQARWGRGCPRTRPSLAYPEAGVGPNDPCLRPAHRPGPDITHVLFTPLLCPSWHRMELREGGGDPPPQGWGWQLVRGWGGHAGGGRHTVVSL